MPQWHLDVPQPGTDEPAPTIPTIFIVPKDLTNAKGAFVFGSPPAKAISIRNRMSRMLLFEFRALNGAILPVVVDPAETVTINLAYSVVGGTCYDLTQFAVGQSPSSVHFSVPIGQDGAKREQDSFSYITPTVTTDAQSSGGYALVILSDQPMLVDRFKSQALPFINATAYADTAISGIGTYTFDANQTGPFAALPGEIAAGMWIGFHAFNATPNPMQLTYKPLFASDTSITLYVPPNGFLSLPLETFELVAILTAPFQSILMLQNIVRSGGAGP